jgi:hypothetical protein
MANQYFDPYYLGWDDGTYGTVNISDAEGAATERARKFYIQGQDRPNVSYFEPPKESDSASDWRKRADAWLKKRGQGSFEPEFRAPLADRPLDGGDSWKRKVLPDILQPASLEQKVKWFSGSFDFQDKKLQALLQEFADAPDWRQAELQGPYSDLKGKVDSQRVELSNQKQNLENARRLESRDAKMLKLAEEDADFDSNWKTVRKIYDKYESGMKPTRVIDSQIKVTEAMLGFYELRDLTSKLSGEFNPELSELHKPEWEKLKQQLAELKAEREKIASAIEKQTIGSKEYKSAHVNASNTLTEKGLNVKGFNLAGRLLAEPVSQYADVKDIASIAGVGPFKNYDSQGNTYTDAEVTEIDGQKFSTESLEPAFRQARWDEAELDSRQKNKGYIEQEAKLRETVKSRPDLVFQLNSALFK